MSQENEQLPEVEAIRAHRLSPRTRVRYDIAWKTFAAWCVEQGQESLPAARTTLERYLLERSASVSVSTLTIVCAAVRRAHLDAGHDSPTEHYLFQQFMAGLQNKVGRPPKPKTAAVADVVKKMADACDTTTAAGVRDRAILLVLFATGMRRSELAAMTWEDLDTLPGEVRFLIRRSKTDQAGQGRFVRMPGENGGAYCPIAALEAWAALGYRSGAIFRSLSRRSRDKPLTAAYFNDVVKRAAERAGYDPKTFGAHSTRRGHVTQAARSGKTLEQIMAKTGHKDANTVVRYIEQNKKLDAGMLGD